jgi:hypothetical protein
MFKMTIKRSFERIIIKKLATIKKVNFIRCLIKFLVVIITDIFLFMNFFDILLIKLFIDFIVSYNKCYFLIYFVTLIYFFNYLIQLYYCIDYHY